jgi:hypothetical protein
MRMRVVVPGYALINPIASGPRPEAPYAIRRNE